VLLYALQRACEKYQFQLHAVCIMTNHMHYLLAPAQPDELPVIMHGLNWYTARCFNGMLKRTGHFGGNATTARGSPVTDRRRATNTSRCTHADPKVAGMTRGYFADFSHYGIYDPPDG